MGSWEEFYANHLPPSDFEDNRQLLKNFCETHRLDPNVNIVLVTVSILKNFDYFFVLGHWIFVKSLKLSSTSNFDNPNFCLFSANCS